MFADPLAGCCVGTLGGNPITYVSLASEACTKVAAKAAEEGVRRGREMERRDLLTRMVLCPEAN